MLSAGQKLVVDRGNSKGFSVSPDLVNGSLEFVGSGMLWANVRRLSHDKIVRGVTWYATSFFMFWGWWNLYYYPALGQWWSFAGGVSIVIANTVWLGQIVYYIRRNS